MSPFPTSVPTWYTSIRSKNDAHAPTITPFTPCPHRAQMKDVLDSQHNAWVTEVFTTWMQGHVSEDALRRALTDSGEMDRWDAVKLGAKDRERLDDALNAVTDLLNTVPPGRPILA